MNKLHIYTGDGKGKTTAAMGLALRSLGHGNRVLIAQFMKNGVSGELKALRSFAQARVMAAPPFADFTFRMSEADRQAAREEQTAFARELCQVIAEFQPQTVILDELGIALSLDMVGPDAAEALIDAALRYGETAITGQTVPDALLARADYISRILSEKHPYATENLPARKGVEW